MRGPPAFPLWPVGPPRLSAAHTPLSCHSEHINVIVHVDDDVADVDVHILFVTLIMMEVVTTSNFPRMWSPGSLRQASSEQAAAKKRFLHQHQEFPININLL